MSSHSASDDNQTDRWRRSQIDRYNAEVQATTKAAIDALAEAIGCKTPRYWQEAEDVLREAVRRFQGRE